MLVLYQPALERWRRTTMPNPIPLCVGIDPGASTSATGLAILRMDSCSIVHVSSIKSPKKGTWWQKRSGIEELLAHDIAVTVGETGEVKYVFIEETQYQWTQAEQSFQRLMGILGLMATRILSNPEGLILVSPTTVKKWVGGHGGCEKPEMAAKAAKMFQDPESALTMCTLIEEEEWDVTDAVAIALCYRYVDEIKENKSKAKAMRAVARKKRRIAVHAGIED